MGELSTRNFAHRLGASEVLSSNSFFISIFLESFDAILFITVSLESFDAVLFIVSWSCMIK